MELWMLAASHVYDDGYEVVGIFSSESEMNEAKKLYLDNKEKCGLGRKAFSFRIGNFVLNEMYY